jgi:hypothetical protein
MRLSFLRLELSQIPIMFKNRGTKIVKAIDYLYHHGSMIMDQKLDFNTFLLSFSLYLKYKLTIVMIEKKEEAKQE